MSVDKARLTVFISGRGSDLQAIIDATVCGTLDARVVLVVSNNPGAYGLIRAQRADIPIYVHKPFKNATAEESTRELMAKLSESGTQYIALAGYLKLIPVPVLRAYPGRILNIHNGLLPKFGGKGMYGLRVHEAVLESGDRESGATVHVVDEIYDHGRILEQARVPVLDGDTPESLAERVLAAEHELYPRVLQKFIRGEYDKS